MCVPDWTPLFNMICTCARALGDLGDNWLNIVLLIVESTVAGQAAVGCAAPTRVGSVWTDVSGVFAAREKLRVVGLTPGMYAVTDLSTCNFRCVGPSTIIPCCTHSSPAMPHVCVLSGLFVCGACVHADTHGVAQVRRRCDAGMLETVTATGVRLMPGVREMSTVCAHA